ncbi:polymorphic toxin-type HINT domain-containing protein [Acidovorax sp. NPDC077664]|uniref:polymorphic toxin-type HINT domain-containing protein n=1 Tax=Acidovorax sp. NPDC077664 TaxID=3390544 RepID=UPI003D0946C9
MEEVREAGEQREQTVATALRGVVRSEDLLVTPGHPFYVPERGFVSVEELQPGDELVSLATQTRLPVKVIVLEAPQGTTHNLTVEAGHTFFVGGLGTWVHNVGPCNTCPAGIRGNASPADTKNVGGTFFDNLHFRSKVDFDTSSFQGSTGFKYKVIQRE